MAESITGDRAHDHGLGGSGGTLTPEPVSDLANLREDWDRLAELAGNVFLSWDWLEAWRRHVPTGEPLVHVCRRDSGEIAAILPLCRAQRGRLRLVRLMGHGPSDELGLLCAPGDREAASAALQLALREQIGDWDLFIGDRLPVQEGWAALLEGPTIHRVASPVLSIDGLAWEEYLAARSRNFRDQVRRRERRLARDHDLRFRLADDPASLERDMETLFSLHAARWPAGTSMAFEGALRPFHQQWAAQALARGWLRLWFLELDGSPAAAWYGFRYGGADWFYQSGRDPRFEREAVGFVLLSHTVRDAMAAGAREYKLLVGGEPYKARFSSAEPELEKVAMARGARGGARLAAARGRRALGAIGRRLLPGVAARRRGVSQ